MASDQVHLDHETRQRWFDALGISHPRRNLNVLAHHLGLKFSHTIMVPNTSRNWSRSVAVMTVTDISTYAYMRLKHNI